MTTLGNLSTFQRQEGKILFASLTFIVLASIAGFLIFSYACPCERTPGGYLFGNESDVAVSDWSFANDVPLCQVQISNGVLPHSINLNCMATTEGKLYLSCSNCETKFWAGKAIGNPKARIRLNGDVYPVTLTRITDPVEMDQAWRARAQKLQAISGPGNPAPSLDAPRADGWWTFNVASAG